MNTTKTELLESLVEQLADIEHQRWSDWQKYCHKVYKDGKFEEFMPRWERQIKTPYSELSETEKQSDRDQVERYLPLLSKALDRYRDIVVEIVESKKLPVPNKYGTTVKVKRYNEVMDEILTALKQTNNNTTKE